MTAPLTRGQIAPLLPTRLSRSDAPAARRGGLLRRVADALAYACDIPRRHALLGRLVSLSDDELAARGLTRADLTRVFDAGFTNFSRRA